MRTGTLSTLVPTDVSTWMMTAKTDNSGIPLGSIQRILGHENHSTTEKSLQSIGDSERQAMSVFEEASRNSHTDSHTDVMGRIGQDG